MEMERRQYRRQKLYAPEFLDMGAENGGVVVNLSEDGLGFQAVGRVEKSRQVTLSFSIATGYRIIARARIAWVGPSGNSGGATFTALPEDSRSILREWLAGVATPSLQDITSAAEQEVIVGAAAPILQPHPIIERLPTPFPPNLEPRAPAKQPSDAREITDTLKRQPQETSSPSVASAQGTSAETHDKETASVPQVHQPPADAPSPAFPPRNTRELFSRSPWISGQTPPEEKRSHTGIIAVIVICVLVIAAVASVPYLRSRRQQIGAAIIRLGNAVAGESTANAPIQSPLQSPAPQAQGSGEATVPAASPTVVLKHQAPELTPAPPASSAAQAHPVAQPPNSQRNPVLPPANSGPATASPASPVTNPAADTGQAEFRRAQQYLTGSGVAADHAEAAQWLWRSVEKGDTNAAIPLAALYLQGDGVSRSCLQAQILLTAAARKGNSEAAQKLNLLPENCE